MYYKNGKKDSVKGLLIIVIEKYIEKKKYYLEKYFININFKIRFIEFDLIFVLELEKFVEFYKSEIDI